MDLEDIVLANVQRGIAWLNETHPDWLGDVHVDKLEMNDCTTCIWGQIHGGFTEGKNYETSMMEAGIYGDTAEVDHGFKIDYEWINDYGISSYGMWQMLTSTWQEEISKLKEGLPA